MTHAVSPRLASYLGLASFALVAGLVLGRPELAAVAAPFVLAVLVARGHEPALTGTLSLDRERALEGEQVTATLELESGVATSAELLVRLPAELEPADAAHGRAVRIATSRTLEVPCHCRRWGAFALGPTLVRVRDPLGFHAWEWRLSGREPLRVYPSAETLRTIVPPLETQVFVGNQLSRTRGEGIEFADIRQWTPGDRLRRINRHVSARRGGLWVNEHHPERNTDVILFLDTFTDVALGTRGTLDLAVRAATSLAQLYLGRKDRVGVVSFGGFLSWLLPASGLRQHYRIVDSLIQMDAVLSFATKEIDVLPPRTLPPKALIVALTPFLDVRSAGALLDLRARGFDLLVVEISPLPFVDPGRGELAELSHRLWRLTRETLRARYEQAGVQVAEWTDGQPLTIPLEEAAAFRRSTRHVRA